MNNERLRSRLLMMGRLGSSMRRRRIQLRLCQTNQSVLALPQRQRTHTVVSRTPTKPTTPPRPPPPRASTPIEEDPYELPASTAPARLAPGGRPRRERVQTERVKAARRAGLPEAQARE